MVILAISIGRVFELIFNGLAALVILGFIVWLFIRAFQRSEERGQLATKWGVTVVIVLFELKYAVPGVLRGGYDAAFGVFSTALAGLVMAITWRKSIAMIIANPFGNLYDGGSTPPEAKPFYSAALTQRKRGNYQEALNLVRQELEKFPTDFEGLMLLADIQVENMNDLQAAEITIQRICNQPEHPPRNVAMALNTLADYYLKYHQDRAMARDALQQVIDRMPETEMAMLAAQRIASLGSTEHLLASHDRKKFTVVEGVQNLGLLDPKFHPKPADVDAAKQAAQLVEHLHAHPLDAEARERLAVIYADHYNRLDLAADQMEQLITHPNQPQKRVVHWLNLLADLQIRHEASYEVVRATLQRIVDMFPHSAAADLAANRIAIIKLELRGKEKSSADVKLGTYEQDIGLKIKK